MLAADLILGLPITISALCRATLKASKSIGLTKADEEAVRALVASRDVRTSLEYASALSGGSPGLCIAQKQEPGSGLLFPHYCP